MKEAGDNEELQKEATDRFEMKKKSLETIRNGIADHVVNAKKTRTAI